MTPRRPDTIAVHGANEGQFTGPLVAPIVQSATFVAESAEAVDDLYEGRRPGYIYTRYANPTNEDAATRIAMLEGMEHCVLTASGMGAISLAVLAFVPAGGTVVSVEEIYGGTDKLFTRVLPKLGITVRRVPATETFDASGADLVYLESPTNPTLRIVDLERAVSLARRAGAVTVIDSTFATPVNSRPAEWGIDVVVHSATKYLGGHSDVSAGAVVASGEHARAVDELSRSFGGTLDPLAGFLLARGLHTLPLRVRKANENGQRMAEHLEARGFRVHYPGLSSHPQHELAKRQMPGGFGGVLSFDLDGFERAAAFVDRLRLIKNAASLGGVESLVSLPVQQSHRSVDDDGLARCGIGRGTVRLALGIEDAEDLIEDVEQALR